MVFNRYASIILLSFSTALFGADFSLFDSPIVKEYSEQEIRIQDSIISTLPQDGQQLPMRLTRKNRIGHMALLYGIAGCGKTQAAHGIVRKADYTFMEISHSEINGGHYSETATNLHRKLHYISSNCTKVGIFIDELDKICDHPEQTNRDTLTTSTALWKWSDFLDDHNRSDIFLICAANDAKHFPQPLMSRFSGMIYELLGLRTAEDKGKALFQMYDSPADTTTHQPIIDVYTKLFKKYPRFTGRCVRHIAELSKDFRSISGDQFITPVHVEQAMLKIEQERRGTDYYRETPDYQQRADDRAFRGEIMQGVGLGAQIAGAIAGALK